MEKVTILGGIGHLQTCTFRVIFKSDYFFFESIKILGILGGTVRIGVRTFW